MIELGRLPHKKLRAGTRLYRIHRGAFGPWYFDGSGDGRFDPVGTPNRGACYWAEDPLGAWVEVFRTRMILTPDDINDRRLSVLTLREALRVPDLASRKALMAGMTAALTAGAEYGPAHELADALQGRKEWRAMAVAPRSRAATDRHRTLRPGRSRITIGAPSAASDAFHSHPGEAGRRRSARVRL